MNELRIDFSTLAMPEPKKAESEKPARVESVPFENYLTNSIKEVNKLQIESDRMIERLAIGDVEDISEVVLASSRAEVAMRMLMEVRNKLTEAYQQISRMS